MKQLTENDFINIGIKAAEKRKRLARASRYNNLSELFEERYQLFLHPACMKQLEKLCAISLKNKANIIHLENHLGMNVFDFHETTDEDIELILDTYKTQIS